MANERLGQIINFAEGLRQDPNGKNLLEGVIENVERLQENGEPVGKERNN